MKPPPPAKRVIPQPTLKVSLLMTGHWLQVIQSENWSGISPRALIDELIVHHGQIDAGVEEGVLFHLQTTIEERLSKLLIGSRYSGGEWDLVKLITDRCMLALLLRRGSLVEHLRLQFYRKLSFLVYDAIRKIKRSPETFRIDARRETEDDEEGRPHFEVPAPADEDSTALEDLDEMHRLATPDQAAVIEMLWRGDLIEEIAAELNVTERTVHNRVRAYGRRRRDEEQGEK